MISGPEAFCDMNVQFAGGAVSKTECYVYWALEQILGDEGEQWSYQESQLGGRQMPGGAVVDFIYWSEPPVAMRIQSFYFHQAVSPFIKIKDAEQRIALETAGYNVIELWEQDFIFDQTGQAVKAVVRDALSGTERPNPLATGLARVV